MRRRLSLATLRPGRFLPWRRASGPAHPDAAASFTINVARLMVSVVTIGFVLLLVRVVQLQAYTPPQLQGMMDDQESTVALQARRGSLLDREGRMLSGSESYFRLYVDPHAVADPGTFSERVAHLLGYDPAWIEDQIARRPNSRFIVIDQHLSPERLAIVRKSRLAGLGLESRQRRQYPLSSAGGQIIGFAGFDGKGLEGAEKIFENRLESAPGRMSVLRTAGLEPLWIDDQDYVPPADGHNIRLSLDNTVQAIAEEALYETCRKYSAKAGQMVVMDPWTGEVLAMANYPPFDPNAAGRTSPDHRRNRCITDIMEPGSTFKPFVWSAATQGGYARPEEKIDCTEGLWVTGAGRRLRDAHGNGMQTWNGVLIKSSNIGMAKIAERMGPQKLHDAVAAFGFGRAPGSELEGESPGMLHPVRKWSGYSISSIPMGQEIGVTPLQITRAFCTFANGGLLVRPTIKVVDEAARRGGRSPYEARVLSQAIADHTRSILRRVVVEGTGRKADSRLYSLFGKTGTAQVPDPGRRGYASRQYIASFIAGAPVHRPRLVIGCFIHHPDPDKGHYGGIVAAPAVKDVLEQALPYLGVRPDHPSDSTQLAAHTADARE